MATFNLRRFTKPDILKKIDKSQLITFLEPYSDYFAGRGLTLPPAQAENGLDYEALSIALANPDPTVNPELFDALFLVNELADSNGMNAILKAIEGTEIDAEIPDKISPEDLAIRVWHHDPAILYLIQSRHERHRPSSFIYYRGAQNATPIALPDSTLLKAIESSLNKIFVKKRRGRTARIVPFEENGHLWFLIRRGAAMNRESVINNDGNSDSLYYQPERYDTVIYNQNLGELRMHVKNNAKWRLKLYQDAFGEHLFHDLDYFTGIDKFTLEPLREYGAASLVCADIDGLDWVQLKEYTIDFVENTESIIHRAENMLGLLDSRKEAISPKGELTKAKFLVQFTDAKAPRTVTISKGNKASFKIDDDSASLESWLSNRGFVADFPEEDDG